MVTGSGTLILTTVTEVRCFPFHDYSGAGQGKVKDENSNCGHMLELLSSVRANHADQHRMSGQPQETNDRYFPGE